MTHSTAFQTRLDPSCTLQLDRRKTHLIDSKIASSGVDKFASAMTTSELAVESGWRADEGVVVGGGGGGDGPGEAGLGVCSSILTFRVVAVRPLEESVKKSGDERPDEFSEQPSGVFSK